MPGGPPQKQVRVWFMNDREHDAPPVLKDSYANRAISAIPVSNYRPQNAQNAIPGKIEYTITRIQQKKQEELSPCETLAYCVRMNPANNIHDTLFRYTMSHKDVAADFLRHYLPEQA
jgi:hypothetical protein